MLAEIGRSERPAWKRPVGRVLKRLLTWRYRDFKPGEQPARWVRVAGLRLRVLPSVFDPTPHFTSGFLAEYLGRPGVVPRGGSVLEIGTGSGILAIASARAGAGRVVATDINPAAARCADENARRYGLSGRIEVRVGDMFAPVAGERFSLIVCNPPYFRGTPTNLAEAAYRAGPDYELLDRFAAGVAAHLEPGGRVIVVLGDAADVPAVLAHLIRDGMQAVEVARRDIWIEVLYICELRPIPKPAEQERDLVGRLRCPACGSGLAVQPTEDETRALCRGCGAAYPRREGVWRMLTSSQEREYAPFLAGYNELRRREGWVRPASYYLGLPHVDKRDPAAHVWRIRQRSFRRLRALVGQGRGRAALDLGSGNGWLARWLAAWGYTAVASDLNAEGTEGLEGGRLYIEHDGNWFGRVQATMDSLPFADAAFVLCTISGSLHYADLGRALTEAARVLAPGGLLLITDSPFYTRSDAGRQMADEQQARIRACLGADPQPLPGGAGYLVEAELLAEMRSAGFRAHTIPTDRRLLSRLRRALRPSGRREQARFPVIVGRKPGGGGQDSGGRGQEPGVGAR